MENTPSHWNATKRDHVAYENLVAKMILGSNATRLALTLTNYAVAGSARIWLGKPVDFAAAGGKADIALSAGTVYEFRKEEMFYGEIWVYAEFTGAIRIVEGSFDPTLPY